MFVGTILTKALSLVGYDQQLTTCVAQRCDLSKKGFPGQVPLLLRITYRLLLQPEPSLSLTGACLSVACPGEGYAK